MLFPRSRVLCVAKNRTYDTEFYERLANGTLVKLRHARPETKLRLANRTKNWYITSAGDFGVRVWCGSNLNAFILQGLCSGDSGGPLLKRLPGEKGTSAVLVGTVSRGTRATHCGGVDTITHYVRIKLFVQWILRYAKKKEGLKIAPKAEVVRVCLVFFLIPDCLFNNLCIPAPACRC